MNPLILLLNAAQDEVEFPVELIDLEVEKPGDVKDYAVISSQTKAILFRSFYNQYPVQSFANAFGDWLVGRGHETPF